MTPPSPQSPEPPENNRKREWSLWFAPELDKREGGSNAALARRLKALGAKGLSSSLITQWKQGTSGPSETACKYLARAWGLPAPFVLRKGGYPASADLAEADRAVELAMARIRESGMTPKDEQETVDYYRERLGDLTALIEARIERNLKLMGIGEQLDDGHGDDDPQAL